MSTPAAAATTTAAPAPAPESTASLVGAKPDAPAPAAAPAAEATTTATPDAAAPAKPAEGTQTPPEKSVVPEKYELKLPEGSPLKPEHLGKIVSFAKERGLSNEQAQAVLEREHHTLTDYVSGQTADLQAKQQAWAKASSEDKEFGGAAFAQNAELAKRALKEIGSPEIIQMLNETKLGDHPEVLRMFVRLGKRMFNDQLVLPGTQAAGKKSIVDILYGSQN